jgi:ribosome-binding protein aMBF1 (putative translation factor)
LPDQEEAEDAEQEEAVELLERVLGITLREQHNGNEEYLGKRLDEEWGYIEQYRGRTA